MAFEFSSLFKKIAGKLPSQEVHQEYTQMKEQTGLVISYAQRPDGLVIVSAISTDSPAIEVNFPSTATDEAHILYTLSGELLRSRAALGQDHTAIRRTVEGLFASYRR